MYRVHVKGIRWKVGDTGPWYTRGYNIFKHSRCWNIHRENGGKIRMLYRTCSVTQHGVYSCNTHESRINGVILTMNHRIFLIFLTKKSHDQTRSVDRTEYDHYIKEIFVFWPSNNWVTLIFFKICLYFLVFFTINVIFHWNRTNSIHNWSILWIVMAWCFSTRPSVGTVLSMNPHISRCLRWLR